MLNDLYFKLCEEFPPNENALYGLPVATNCLNWLAIDSSAFPALFLPVCKDDLRPDIVLRSVEVLFSRDCTITTIGEETHEGCFSLVRLKENDPDIVRLFLRILEERFPMSDFHISNAAIAINIQKVAELFDREDGDTRDLIGLWGELYIISRTEIVDAAVRCWSRQKTAKHDFVSESFVLDIKTTLKVPPKHRFSLEQLRPKGTIEAYVASLCVIEVQTGKTVGSLVDAIAARMVDQKLRSVFLTQCLEKGGRELYSNDLMLKNYPDNDAIAVFRAQDIPVPRIGSDDPIENIRFDIDLSKVQSISNHYSKAIFAF